MKKGQIAIFAIISLMLVASIAVVFLMFSSPELITGSEFEPQRFIDSCIRESIRQKTDLMLIQGGFADPTDYKIYNDTKVTYLCKNINYYEPCIVQYPLYVSAVEQELENQIRPDIEGCFIELEDELRRRNYQVQGGEMDLDASFKPGVVEVNIERDFSYSREEESRRFDSFTSSINNPLYELTHVANEIVFQEGQFCYFEYLGYSLLYNQFDIRKTTMSDSTRIYTIKHKPTGGKMMMAIRGCATPHGLL